MKFLIVLICLIGFTYGDLRPFIDSKIAPMSDEMIKAINSIGTTWKAGRNFNGQSFDQVKQRFGARMEKSDSILPEFRHKILKDLPASFDSRLVWPECTSLRLIRDQSRCGSCWAFGAVEAMSDRICISSQGKIQVDLSAEEPVACCTDCGFGCDGGWPQKVYDYYQKSGIVSGGLYNGTGCEPYSISPDATSADTPKCTNACVPSYGKKFADDKHFGQPGYTVKGEQQMMQEILTNGPITATFSVYSDFTSYKSGVYQHVSQDIVGGHAIKIIGWGTEDGVDYWIVANSWGTSWGEKGYFRIKRGSNESDIETDISTGLPKL